MELMQIGDLLGKWVQGQPRGKLAIMFMVIFYVAFGSCLLAAGGLYFTKNPAVIPTVPLVLLIAAFLLPYFTMLASTYNKLSWLAHIAMIRSFHGVIGIVHLSRELANG